MAAIPNLMGPERTEIVLPVRPWYRDHCFGGKTILPAVETMHVLAAAAKKNHPQLDVTTISSAHFQRFVEIPPATACLRLFVELHALNGGVQASLLTRQQRKAMSRMMTHSSMFFDDSGAPGDTLPAPEIPPPEPATRTVSASRLYAELVPFGSAYRTLAGRLELGLDSARGTLVAARHPFSCALLGSPFPLDGAMHAACVHGQQIADFVPFPVSFARRRILRPTQPGIIYRTTARLVGRTPDELVYDLWIYDEKDALHETISALGMRDVSGGGISPPAWIKRDGIC